MARISKELDRFQAKVHTKFNREHYLNNPKKVERLIDWVTFYRRNVNAFIKHYLGINLHLFQAIWIYCLSVYNDTVIVASRADSKTFTISVFAVAMAILYPNSKVVISATVKKQSEIIINDKIQNELMQMSPNLRREIDRISKDNSGTPCVYFKNGSYITVVVASDNGRGARSTILILEEFRMIKKFILDSVLKPLQIIRYRGFMTNNDTREFYENIKELDEESRNLYISSAWWSSHWMNDLVKSTFETKFKDNSSILLAADYSLALKHKIKTKRELKSAKRTTDIITWRIEYENEMVGENMKAYYTHDMLNKNQRIKPGQVFYPQSTVEFLSGKKNKFAIKKQAGEIRIISCDFAFVKGSKNDNSCFHCIRLLPESVKYDNGDGETEVQTGYRRVDCYIETMKGAEGQKIAVRVKQLFNDFEADYCVMDMRNGGELLYDLMARVLYDEERQCEYQPWRCFNDENVASRVNVSGALECVFSIKASEQLNSDMARSLQNLLTEGRIDFIINHTDAIEKMQKIIPEYTDTCPVDVLMRYEKPYLETQALFNEMVMLEIDDTRLRKDIISLHEKGANTKDRYVSLAYGSYFASLLEQELFSNKSDYEYNFDDDDSFNENSYDDEWMWN